MSIQLIRRAVPEADEAIVEYIEGYLRENDFEEDEDAIVDFVKPILLDAGGEEAKIDELCLHLSSLIMPRENKRGLIGTFGTNESTKRLVSHSQFDPKQRRSWTCLGPSRTIPSEPRQTS